MQFNRSLHRSSTHAIDLPNLRADFGVSEAVDVLKLVDELRDRHIEIMAVAITRLDNQPAARGRTTLDDSATGG